MRRFKTSILLAGALVSLLGWGSFSAASDDYYNPWTYQDVEDQRRTERAAKHQRAKRENIQLGVRPHYLVDGMRDSALKTKLQQCSEDRPKRSDFSIGHRGAPMQFPEHTLESYTAAARQGAGILECDVTFTKDRQLVCRHSQCDLHTTTNILATDLADKCTQPFTPADAEAGTPATARCCTSDITLAEFKTLCGKMDAANSSAATVEEYLAGTADWRTDLYSTCGTLLTHAESIELFSDLGTKFTPELKSPSVEMPYEGDYTQQDYARQMIREYKQAGVKPRNVWAQSFNKDDVLFWLDETPRFGKQAVFLDSRVYDPAADPREVIESLDGIAADGINIVAPPMFALVTLDDDDKIVPSEYALAAHAAGLDIIAWTFERSDLRKGAIAADGNTNPPPLDIHTRDDLIDAFQKLGAGWVVRELN